MKMKFIYITILALVLAFLSCQELAVQNENEPDTERALATPGDVEGLVSSSARRWEVENQKYGLSWTLSTMADENSSSWGNVAMNDMSSEPRKAWDNNSTYSNAWVLEEFWYGMYNVISSCNDGLKAINAGMTIPDPTTGSDQTPRTRAFAKLMQGLAHGYLALIFDKAFIFDETVDLETQVLDYSTYDQVMDAALAQLAECANICASNTFTVPSTWWNGLELSNADMEALAHSYTARFMACVARDETERAAVDWNAVINHADQGITTDFAPVGDWATWWDELKRYSHNPTWMRADYKTIGPADNSGAYQAWLATPVKDRTYFLIVTDDRRVVGADSATADGTHFRYLGPAAFNPARGSYHFSYYGAWMHADYYNNGGVGPMNIFDVSELDMLKAEGYYRLNQRGEAAALVNLTRVTNGQLPEATAGDADLLDKIKYEKRFETFATGCGVAFFDSRGWGDLVSGTPIHFPVPGKELEILQEPIYTWGGGGEGSAPKMGAKRPHVEPQF